METSLAPAMPGYGRVSLLRLVVVGMLTAILAGLFAPGAMAGGTKTGLEATGKLPILWPKGEVWRESGSARFFRVTLIIDSPARRAYQLYDLRETPNRPDRIGIRSFDLDTLKPLRFATLEGSPYTLSGDWIYARAEGQRRLFLPLQVLAASGANVEFDGIAVVDLVSFDGGRPFVVKRLPVPLEHTQVRQMGLFGMSYFPTGSIGGGKLLLLFGKVLDEIALRPMVQWDASTGAADWLYEPAACSKAWMTGGGGNYPVPVWKSAAQSAIYATCTLGPSQPTAVLRLNLGPNGSPSTEETLLGPTAQDSISDPASDRVILGVRKGTTGMTGWVADGRTLSFVGAIGLALDDNVLSYGLDRSSGRFYSLRPNGRYNTGVNTFSTYENALMLTDTRLTPAPQVLLFPEYGYQGIQRIHVDSASGSRPARIFLRRGGATSVGVTYPEGKTHSTLYPREDFFLVIADHVPVPRQADLADLDRLTADRPERAGETDASFDGLGSAYGARVKLVGGFNAALRSEVASPTDDLARDYAPACWTTDREFVAGQVPEAHLSSLQANATARSIDADAPTKADLEEPLDRCQPSATPHEVAGSNFPWPFETLDGAAGRQWPFEDVECAGDQTREESENASYPVPNDLHARTVCAQSKKSVEASSDGAPLSLGGVRIGESASSVEVHRDETGIRVVSRGIARGIELPGLRIDSVVAEAIAHTAGRRGTVRTEYHRTVCGIHTQDQDTRRCFTDEQIAEFIAGMNRALGVRGRIRLPDPDKEYSAGTPRGYAAEVRRNQHETYTAALLNSDYRLEVPGLEITIYKDNYRGAGRHIIMLAGVRASTTYGIFVLPKGFDFPEPAPLPLPTIAPPSPVLPTVAPTVAPPPPQGPGARIIERVRGFLVRSLDDGLLVSGVWFAIGLPFFLALRRTAFARSFLGRRSA